MKASMQTLDLVNERLHLLSASEYQRLAETGLFTGRRVELMHGRVVDMGPMGDAHDWLVERLTMVLVERFGALASVRVQLSVRANPDSMPEPDFLLVPRREKPGARPRKGLLVVEIADSSLRYDRKVKAPLYAAGATPEYWIVNVRRSALEVYRKPRAGVYTQRLVLHRGDTVTPVAFPGIELPLHTFLR
jgi:Uma2 family endonuclease